jgi:hypothetical protein
MFGSGINFLGFLVSFAVLQSLVSGLGWAIHCVAYGMHEVLSMQDLVHRCSCAAIHVWIGASLQWPL